MATRSAKIGWPRSLRTRLLVVFVAGMALSAGLVAVGVVMLAEPFSKHMLRSGIDDYAEGIARQVRFDAAGQPTGLNETKIEPWVFVSLGEEAALRILDEHGRVAYAPDPGAGPLAPDAERFDPTRRAFALVRDGVAMHASTAPLRHAGRRWYVQFAVSDRLVLLVRRSIGMQFLKKGIAATCVTLLVIFLVTIHFTLRRALQPLRAASDAAQRITPRTLDARLDADAQPIEIRPLVDGFNQALDRLQHGFRTQQEFLSSAAHELKTPLALIRAQVELGPPDERKRLLLQDVDRMARQVQQLLLLAEVSEPQNFRIEPVDPRPTLHEVFDYMARVAERRSVCLDLRIDDAVRQWRADRGALFTLLKNLLENAIQHSPAGGAVALSVSACGFSVVDEGPGVPAEHLPRMFARFWRSPERRDEGAGLGLAICLEIAMAHGWRLQARCRERGLEVCAVMDAQAAHAASS
jgi:signal transduction histidine kinase